MSTDPGSQSPFTDPTSAASDSVHPDATAPITSPWADTEPSASSATMPMPPSALPPPAYPGSSDASGSSPYPPQQSTPPPAPPYPGQYPQPGQAYPPYGAGAPAPGYGPQNPYNPYGPYAGATGGVEHPQGTTILVLGIVGLLLCQIAGPVAWIMGRNTLREIDSSGQHFSNRGQVKAGMICGIIATVLTVLGILFYVVAFAAMMAGAGTSIG